MLWQQLVESCDCTIRLADHKADLEGQLPIQPTLVGTPSVPNAVGRQARRRTTQQPLTHTFIPLVFKGLEPIEEEQFKAALWLTWLPMKVASTSEQPRQNAPRLY